jgi:hypothetical protein
MLRRELGDYGKLRQSRKIAFLVVGFCLPNPDYISAKSDPSQLRIFLGENIQLDPEDSLANQNNY